MALDPLIAALTQSANQSRQQQESQWSTPGFIFGQGTNTPDLQSLQRRREMADQLINASLSRAPQTFGEGLTAIGQALAGRMQDKRIREEEESARAGASEAFSSTVGGGASIGAPVPRSAGGMADQEFAPNGGVVVDDATRISGGGKMSGDQQEFIEAMMPHALRVSERTGLDPRLVIAQAAQETGWGRSAPGNNFFGIKSHGKAGGATHSTHEYVNGQRVNIQDSFRQYGDMGESADGYAEFLQTNPRYRQMLAAGDLDGQLEALGQSGYATDPNYAQSVGSIARSIQLPDMQAQTPVNVADAATQRGVMDTSQPTLLGVTGQGGQSTAMIRMADGSVTQVPAQDTGDGYMIEGMGMAGDIGQPVVSTGGQAPQQQPQQQQTAPQQAGGMDATIVQLAQLAANPYLAPEKKAIVEKLINQQMQNADPMRQMQMQKLQMQIDQMGQPQQGYQQVFGRDLGLEGDAANTMFNIGPDGKISQVGGSGVNVNVNNRGNIPAGFQVITDPETGAERMEPIPGSPAAMDQEAADRGAVGRQAQRERAGGTVIQDLQRALDLLPELGPISGSEGVMGGIARQGLGIIPGQADIPGTVANRITQFTESALSNVGLDTLQQMRENSPTGGALGQVPIQQQQRLEQVLGSLNINQPPSELEANIKRVMNIYTDIIYGSAQERAMAVQEGRMTPQENAEIEQMYQELPFDERGRRREDQGQGGAAELEQHLSIDTSNFTLEELREHNRRTEELLQ